MELIVKEQNISSRAFEQPLSQEALAHASSTRDFLRTEVDDSTKRVLKEHGFGWRNIPSSSSKYSSSLPTGVDGITAHILKEQNILSTRPPYMPSPIFVHCRFSIGRS